MIWNAIQFITLSEIIGWVVFIAVTVVLGAFGLRSDTGTGQAVMMICWLALFAGAYRLLSRRR
jgi:flagellin-like protein